MIKKTDGKCELCGQPLIERKRLSGDKEGLRYLVCSKYPECKFRKGIAEEGKPHIWNLENGKFKYLAK
ncbi:MAG: topoisomerase DNA-binding C4 zinc finger domain-containing protein [Desulfuromonadaceae bacterium]|nr:topoisomerase DNA-binding C4 zinc finger domain-containing protein [Desulfuromonadaceae bacterium]